MAQRTIVELTDDLDGGKADVTVAFGLEGKGYEIDVSEKNARKLRAALAEYMEAARRVAANGGRGRKLDNVTRRGSKGDTAAIRTWAAANGHKVSDRGRIPAAVQAAYTAAQS